MSLISISGGRGTAACLVALAWIGSAGWLSGAWYLETAGTQVEQPEELTLQNVTIVEETVVAGGKLLLQVVADVQNTSEAVFNLISMRVADAVSDQVVEAAENVVELAELAAGTVVQGEEAFWVIVDAANLDVFQEALGAGQILAVEFLDDLGVPVVDPETVRVIGTDIITVVEIAPRQILVGFTVTFENFSTHLLRGVRLWLTGSTPELPYGTLNTTVVFPETLESYGTLSAPAVMHVMVDEAQADQVRAQVLSGEGLALSTQELWVYNQPPRGVDEAMEESWTGSAPADDGDTDLIFSSQTFIPDRVAAGELLIEDPGLNRLDPPGGGGAPPVLGQHMPFEVHSVFEKDGNYHVRGVRRQLIEVLQSGTFIQNYRTAYDDPVRDPYKPELGNTYTAEERQEREALAQAIEDENPRDGRLADLRGMSMIPWHFNELPIGTRIRLSGQVLIGSSGLEMEVKVRQARLNKVSARMELGAELNVVLESDDGTDNSGDPAEAREQRVFLLPLPPLTVNIGGVPASLQPVLSLDVGAEAFAPSRLHVPLQSAFSVGVEMGWTETEGTFYTPLQEFVPLRVSDPAVFEEYQAGVHAWAELGLELKGSIAWLVEGGPRVALRTDAGLTVAPLLDPWWELDFRLGLIGQLNLNFLGLSVLNEEATLFDLGGFNLDAGGPLLTPPAAQALSLPAAQAQAPALKPLAGRDTRWARLYQHARGSGSFEQGFVIPGADGSLFIGGSNAITHSYARYSPEGDLLWTKGHSGLGPLPWTAVGEPADGGFVAAGRWGNGHYVACYDADGNTVWSHRYDRMAFPRELLRAEENGEPVYYLCGYINAAPDNAYDPVVIKYDASGNVAWSRQFSNPGEDDQFFGLALAPDGDIVLCGRTTEDVAPPPFGTPAAGNVIVNAGYEGLLARISPAGDLRWARAYVNLALEQVVVAPDGTVFVGAQYPWVVTIDRPCIVFGRLTADGTLLDHVMVGKDLEWDDEIPGHGISPWDVLHDLAWSDGSLYACGAGSLYNTSAWVIKLNEKLGVQHYTLIDGPLNEGFLGLADTGTGIALFGSTTSGLPWGSGGEGAGLLALMPYEGMLRFHPDLGIRSLYLQPWVYKSSGTLDFALTSTAATVPPRTYLSDTGSVPFALLNYPLTRLGTVPGLVDQTQTYSAVAQATSPALINDYASWQLYHGIPYTGDTSGDRDGDTLPDTLEAYLGLNPAAHDNVASIFNVSAGLTGNQPVLRVEFERSRAVGDLSLRWQASPNLTPGSWAPVTPLNSVTTVISDKVERIAAEFELIELSLFLRPEVAP